MYVRARLLNRTKSHLTDKIQRSSSIFLSPLLLSHHSRLFTHALQICATVSSSCPCQYYFTFIAIAILGSIRILPVSPLFFQSYY